MSAAPNSAERVLAILDLFEEERSEWTPEEMMARLGYSRPTLYRYLKALREAGLLTSLPRSGFTLGPRVTELDFLVRRSDPLIRAGEPALERLAAQFPCSALLVRWYGRKLLCVASVCSAPEPRSSYPRGRPMPLARGAISRAILAHLPRRKQIPLIEAHLPEFADLDLGATAGEIAASLRRVRQDGVAIARGEVTPGVVGVAAPVFDAGHAPIAALCATSDERDVAGARLDRVAAAVRGLAETITRALAETRDDAPAAPARRTA